MVKELLATLTTNSQGEATYTYTGAGAGNIKFSAESTNNDNIISGIYNVFDCPVYDGDNIPISINFSKTNNAVVTDEVVSLIASVKNTNNNPCINIPVTFTQGNTILGHAYTDCTGDATITHVWEDSDIFDVTATVGENLSEDITMFVKDKDLTYLFYDIGVTKNNNQNQWIHDKFTSKVTVTPNGTTIESLAGLSTNFINKLNTDENAFDYTELLTIEFDVVSINANNMQIQFYDNVNLGVIRPNTHDIISGSHVKIKYTGEKLITTVDGISKPDVIVNFTSPYRIGFRIQESQYIKYKNFIAYVK